MTVLMHPFTADGWELYRALRLRSLQQAARAFGSRMEDERRLAESGWRRRAGAGSHLWAEVDGEPAGLVGVVDEPEGPLLVSMWVDPAHRGTGVGDLMIEAAVVLATTRDPRPVRLWVACENAPARRLYARHGFVPPGRQEAMRGIPGRHQLEMVRE